MTAAKILELPPDTCESSIEWASKNTWPGTADGLVAAVLVDRHPPLDPDAPFLADLVPRTLSLSKYSSFNGWEDVCTVPATSNGLTTSRNGSMCSFTVMTNAIPEEAERGEYWICKLESGATAAQITVGAGRVIDGGGSLLSPDGSMLIFSANYNLTKPITTTCDLWMANTESIEGVCAIQQPTKITEGKSVLDFGWVVTPPGASNQPISPVPPKAKAVLSRYKCIDSRGVAVRAAPLESSSRSTGPLFNQTVDVTGIVLGADAKVRYLCLADGKGYLPLESPSSAAPSGTFCFELVPLSEGGGRCHGCRKKKQRARKCGGTHGSKQGCKRSWSGPCWFRCW